MIFVGDTETTGVGGKDEVIQFAGFVCDKGKIIDVINFYSNPSIIIKPDASRVSGITNRDIPILSKGKFFEECIKEYPILYRDNMKFTFYNASFDTRLVNQSLVLHGQPKFDFGSEVISLRVEGRHFMCAMKQSGHGRIKLVNLFHKLMLNKVGNLPEKKVMEITLKSLTNLLDRMGKPYDINRLKAHDALFDAYLLYLVAGDLNLLNE